MFQASVSTSWKIDADTTATKQDSENHNREYTWKAFATCKFIQASIIMMVVTGSHLLTKYYKPESRDRKWTP